jgi:type II secretory ATPase GspE/PulE/Tfp pilus assembly ATPase PilB-like protein
MMRIFNGPKKPAFVPDSFGDTSPLRFNAFAATEAHLPAPPNLIAQHVVYSLTAGRPYGEVAVNLGLLTRAALSELTAEQEATNEPVSDLAIRRGLLTSEQHARILNAQAVTVHVDNRHAGNPQFLTWVGDLTASGNAPEIIKVTAQTLEELRVASSQTTETENVDLVTVNKARRMYTDFAAINASDMTLLIRETHAEVQVRVNGDIKVVPSLTMKRHEGEKLARAIYTGLSTIKGTSYIHSQFQDALIAGEALPGTGLTGIRIKRGPCYPEETNGTFISARLQYKKQSRVLVPSARPVELAVPERPGGSLNIPGLTPSQLELFERLVRIPMGVVLVTGPTGSGKTTMIYEGMKHQAREFPHLRQVTMERPVEYPMPWAIQLIVGDKEDFQDYVARALRMDPDTILLGEVSKAEEAIALWQSAMTGHFSWGTLHLNDAFGIPNRLEMLDHQRLSLRTVCNHETLAGMVAVRLLPKLCSCKKPLLSTPDAIPSYMTAILKTWNADLSNVHVRGDGCSKCSGAGITSREAVAEIVLTDEQLMYEMVEKGVQVARRNHRRREGSDKSMLAHAIDRIFAGECSPNDVNSKLKIEPKALHED